MAIPARFPSSCGSCGRRVAVGDQIEKIPGASQWRHAECPDPEQLDLGLGGPAGAVSASGRGNRTTSADPGPSAAPPAVRDEATRVWTDGACSGNPGPGGWAWATRDGRQGSGAETPSTNQRMEIRAALEAIRAIDGPLVVISDSTYVVNCFRDSWWRGWITRGWTTSAKKPVANRDLWEPLVEAVRSRDVTFQWVKGHSGDEMNDMVDALAVAASRSI